METQDANMIRSMATERLERHRLAFTLEKRMGPLLRFSELTPLEQGFITAEFVRCSWDVPDSDGSALERIYVEKLHSWGIMCPHPIGHCLYDGLYGSTVDIPFEESQWFSCGLCRTRVVNRAA